MHEAARLKIYDPTLCSALANIQYKTLTLL
jgi:hypothetical protein